MSALHLPIEMAEREAEWSFVLQHLDGFKFWSGQLDWNENGVPGRLVPLFAARKIAVVSERMYWPPVKAEGASDTSHNLLKQAQQENLKTRYKPGKQHQN